MDRDMFLFDGNADQVVYISRKTRLVALRLGGQPPKSPEWDNSVIPNLLIGGIDPPVSGLCPQSINDAPCR